MFFFKLQFLFLVQVRNLVNVKLSIFSPDRGAHHLHLSISLHVSFLAVLYLSSCAA